MRKQAVFSVVGMNRDLAQSKTEVALAYENMNLRLRTDENNSFLVMTNEIGPYKVALTRNGGLDPEPGTPNNVLLGRVLGVCPIQESLIVFTHQIGNPGSDRIYRVRFNTTDDDAEFALLYRGNLNFDMKHPIECIPFYENEKMQRIYWTDGKNMPRTINIAAELTEMQEWTDTSFDFALEINGAEQIHVDRERSGNALFPACSIQYAFSYFVERGPESAIVRVSPMNYASWDRKERGGAADETSMDVQFQISLDNLSDKYEYVRLYSIIYTSVDTTPQVKHVKDLKIVDRQVGVPNSGKVRYTDTNREGSFITDTDLLFKIGKNIVCQTMTQKDNTLFIGNIEDKSGRLTDAMKSYLGGATVTVVNDTRVDLPKTDNSGVYPYKNQLGKKLNLEHSDKTRPIRYFKYREQYRLGLQFQDKYGNWSDVYHVGDYDVNIAPEQGYIVPSSGQAIIKFAQFKTVLNNFPATTTFKDFVAVRPVVVYPLAKDRGVIAQGILTPTIYNLQNRVSGSSYAQSSWFARPIISEQEINKQKITYRNGQVVPLDEYKHKNKWVEFRHWVPLPPTNENLGTRAMDTRGGGINNVGQWYNYAADPAVDNDFALGVVPVYDNSRAEIVCNFDSYKYVWNVTGRGRPAIGYNINDNFRIYALSNQEAADAKKSQYFVDQSILTFHSPDIEFDAGTQALDMGGAKLRIVGIVPLSSQQNQTDVVFETPKDNDDIYDTRLEDFKKVNKINKKYTWDNASYEIPVEYEVLHSTTRGQSYKYNDGKKWTWMSRNLFNPSPAKDRQYVYMRGKYFMYPFHTKTISYDYIKWGRDKQDKKVLTDDKRELNGGDVNLGPTPIHHTLSGTSGEYSNASIIRRGDANSTIKKKTYTTLLFSYNNYYLQKCDTNSGYELPEYRNIPAPVIAFQDGSDRLITKDSFDKAIDILTDVNTVVVPSCENQNDPGNYVPYFSVPGKFIMFHEVSTSSEERSDEENQEQFLGDVDAGAYYSHGLDNRYCIPKILSSETVEMKYKSSTCAIVQLGRIQDSTTGEYGLEILPRIDFNNYVYNDFNNVLPGGVFPMNIGGAKAPLLWTDDVKFIHQKKVQPLEQNRMTFTWQPLRKEILVVNNNHPDATIGTATLTSGFRDFGFFYLAELFRDNADFTNRFGDVNTNNWMVAGHAVSLPHIDGNNVTISWIDGDTYYQRYDNLHTYPYTDEDINQIVDIVSFMCETRVNIDGRHDDNRILEDYKALRNDNMNLINPVYSQNPNYFQYRVADYRQVDNTAFPTTVAWSETKQPGEYNDSWSRVTLLANTMDMDGIYGPVRALRTLNNDIFCFQDKAVGKILYNERYVATDGMAGVPLQIANSAKVSGKVYLSEKIGCHNKWSIAKTPSSLFFVDDNMREIFMLGGDKGTGLAPISSAKGFKSWMAVNTDPTTMWNPDDFTNIVANYDHRNKEVLFITKNEALSYNEEIQQFTSFYNYEKIPFVTELDDETVLLDSFSQATRVFKLNKGQYNHFYTLTNQNGEDKPFWTTIFCKSSGQEGDTALADRTWTNVSFQFDSFDPTTGLYQENDRFDRLETWTEYQHGVTTWSTLYPGVGKKFRMWHGDMPRDMQIPYDRMRNPWLKFKLSKEDTSQHLKSVIHNIIVSYLE